MSYLPVKRSRTSLLAQMKAAPALHANFIVIGILPLAGAASPEL